MLLLPNPGVNMSPVAVFLVPFQMGTSLRLSAGNFGIFKIIIEFDNELMNILNVF